MNYVKNRDRKSTRLNSSHANISYAVFCLKKKNIEKKYNQEKMSRFQGEKEIQRKGIYFGKDFSVSLQGTADLIIETDQRKEIIDYKTGKTIEDQFDFYAFLLYGEEGNVEGRYFYLLNGISSPANKKEPLSSSFLD